MNQIPAQLTLTEEQTQRLARRMEAVAQRLGAQVAWLERSGRLLSGSIDPQVAALAASWHGAAESLAGLTGLPLRPSLLKGPAGGLLVLPAGTDTLILVRFPAGVAPSRARRAAETCARAWTNAPLGGIKKLQPLAPEEIEGLFHGWDT